MDFKHKDLLASTLLQYWTSSMWIGEWQAIGQGSIWIQIADNFDM